MTNANADGSDRGLVLGNTVLVAEVFAKHGFLVLSNVTGEEKTAEVNYAPTSQCDALNQLGQRRTHV